MIDGKKIKKPYISLYELLVANQDKKVSEILPEFVKLTKTKKSGEVYRKDENGKVVALFCAYYQKWFDPNIVSFGLKAGSPSGYNTMCREGLNNKSSQLREMGIKQAKLIDKIVNENLTHEMIAEEKKKITLEKEKIIPMKKKSIKGFDTAEECIVFSNS